MNTPSALLRPHHVNYVVSDLDRSIPFYRDLLGFNLIQDAMRENLPSYDAIFGRAGIRVRVALFELPDTKLLLELFQFFHPEPIRREVTYHAIGSSHTAFEVCGLDEFCGRLVACGEKFLSAPVDIVREGRLLARAVYLLDPDGIVIELLELNAGSH